MIVTTINVNGIRAAIKQRSSENLGLLPWLAANEGRSGVPAGDPRRRRPAGGRARARAVRRLASGFGGPTSQGPQWRCDSESRHPIEAVRDLIESDEFALHGRYLEVDIAGLTVASLYIQTGEAGTDRQLEKERFMARARAPDGDADRIRPRRRGVRRLEYRAHRERHQELEGQRQEVGVSARASGSGSPNCWPPGWVDVVRVLHPDVPGPYSWWSWRGRAFDNDAGWRIDYQLATRGPGGAGSAPRGSSGPRRTRCAGPTTRR